MSDIVTIAGSPSYPSRSTAVLDYTRTLLEQYGLETAQIAVRDLPAEDVLFGRFDSVAVQEAVALVSQATGVIIGTPIYKAAYTGALKAFLDLLPQRALQHKIVLPVATGGSPLHMLSLDYALKPVLAALGAQHVLSGVYIVDAHIQWQGTSIHIDAEIEQRLHAAVADLVEAVSAKAQRTTSLNAVLSGVS